MKWIVNCVECGEEIKIDLAKNSESFKMNCPCCKKELGIDITIFVEAVEI